MKKLFLIITGIILLFIGPVIFLTGIALTSALPKIFSGTAHVQIIFPDSIQEKSGVTVLKSLTETQTKIIDSVPIIDRLIQNLNLQERWGRQLNDNEQALTIDIARSILRRSVKVASVPESFGLISITVYQQDPNMVATIANELAHIYQEAVDGTEQQGGVYQVRIIGLAEKPSHPSYPKVILNMFVSLIVAGLLFLIGIIILIKGIGAGRKGNFQ